MTSDPFDPFEPKEQTKASAVRPASGTARAPLRQPASAPVQPAADAPAPAAPVVSASLASEIPAGEAAGATPAANGLTVDGSRKVRTGASRSHAAERPAGAAPSAMAHRTSALDRFGGHGTLLRFAITAGVSGLVATVLLFVMAMGIASGNENKILAGVHVGTVDLGGATKTEAIAKLQAAYAYLSQGEVTVATPVGSSTITYAQAGRQADVDAMAAMALEVGHSGDSVADSVAALRTAAGGVDIPIVVKVDPSALAMRIHEIVGTTAAGATDAKAMVKDGAFTATPAAAGKGVDEKAISAEIIGELVNGQAPADVKAGGAYVEVSPVITDKQAQDAIAEAHKMVVDVKVVWDKKSWTIPKASVQSWIVFGMRTDGTYGPAVDPTQIAAWLAGTPSKSNVAAVEPTVKWDSAGKPAGLNAGTDGIGIDITPTTESIADYLDSLASGGSPVASIAVSTTAIHAKLAETDLKGFTIIGSWTTTFFPGESNGNGANIRVPAKVLNGQVIAPGQQFSFLGRVGPIDAAHGFTDGGVIINGKSEHTGAMGGGICSASTTLFNAAARAGLEIDERHNHAYYVNRYPSGLDATVFSDGSRIFDMKFTNDTPNPIIIRSWATKGSKSTITFQLWTLPINRTVTFNGIPAGQFKGGSATNKVTASDTTVIVSNRSLKPNVTYRAEYPTDGFDTSVVRIVKDASGNVLYTNSWKSHYIVVNGLLQMGATPSITPTPTGGAPTPAPKTPPPATTPPEPTPTPTGARKRRQP